MLPSLFPCMILTGFMVRYNLVEYAVKWLQPVLQKIYKLSAEGCFVMVVGFLCGFPLGAKTVQELYTKGKLSFSESRLLLSYCNNIGPAYYISFYLHQRNLPLKGRYFIGMYGIPLIYGFLYGKYLAHTPSSKMISGKNKQTDSNPSFLDAFENSLENALCSIFTLGAYMIICNLLLIPLQIIYPNFPKWIGPLIEISQGLTGMQTDYPAFAQAALVFGGLSCHLQTFSCLKDRNLRGLKNEYIFHKVIQSCLAFLYFRFF